MRLIQFFRVLFGNDSVSAAEAKDSSTVENRLPPFKIQFSRTTYKWLIMKRLIFCVNPYCHGEFCARCAEAGVEWLFRQCRRRRLLARRRKSRLRQRRLHGAVVASGGQGSIGVWSVAFSLDEAILITVDKDGHVKRWPLTDGTGRQTYGAPARTTWSGAPTFPTAPDIKCTPGTEK